MVESKWTYFKNFVSNWGWITAVLLGCFVFSSAEGISIEQSTNFQKIELVHSRLEIESNFITLEDALDYSIPQISLSPRIYQRKFDLNLSNNLSNTILLNWLKFNIPSKKGITPIPHNKLIPTNGKADEEPVILG